MHKTAKEKAEWSFTREEWEQVNLRSLSILNIEELIQALDWCWCSSYDVNGQKQLFNEWKENQWEEKLLKISKSIDSLKISYEENYVDRYSM